MQESARQGSARRCQLPRVTSGPAWQGQGPGAGGTPFAQPAMSVAPTIAVIILEYMLSVRYSSYAVAWQWFYSTRSAVI